MTPYYDGEKNAYLIDGVPMTMTEEQIEDFQDANPEADIQAASKEQVNAAMATDDDVIDCTCTDEDDLCPECEKFWREMADEV